MLEVCSDTKEVKLTFLHPHIPSNLFKYPETQNIHIIPMDDIITLVDPRTRSGHVYSLIGLSLLCSKIYLLFLPELTKILPIVLNLFPNHHLLFLYYSQITSKMHMKLFGN